MLTYMNQMMFVAVVLTFTSLQPLASEVLKYPEDSAAIEREEAAAKQAGCRPIKRVRNLFVVLTAARGQGQVCLVQDLMQQHRYDSIDGRGDIGSPAGEGIVQVKEARDLDLDLRGHLVTGEPFDNTDGLTFMRPSSNVTVRNGRIRTPGPRSLAAIAAGPYSPDYVFFEGQDLPAATWMKLDDPQRKTYRLVERWDYKPPRHYTLDNLTIYSGGRGVALAGSNNTLRNSTIEVDSAVAAYFYGPNAVIENNTFIVHQSTDKDVPATSALLKLRDAHGAVIRNNRFIVKGLFTGQAEAAINLLESKDVVIEGNTVEGAKSLVRKDAASTTKEQDNVLK